MTKTKTNKANLTDAQREQVALYLLQHNTDLKPQRGSVKTAAAIWGVTRKTISIIWSGAKNQRQNGDCLNVKATIKGKKGRETIECNVEAIKAVPYSKRRTNYKLSKEIGVSESLIRKWLLEKKIRKHTNSLKPLLTDQHKVRRLQFCLESLYVDHANNKIKFISMDNVIHIDEKWFYLCKDGERYILVPGEEEPHRVIANKNYIPKVMFMAAIARPVFGSDGEVLFDGKLGIFPFTKQVKAMRRSKNRPAGTWLTVPEDSVDKECIRRCIVDKIIPAIKQLWPAHLTKNLIIQQDNATTHIAGNDEEFLAAANSDGWHMVLRQQPAKSPDMNANDLGFFNAIQSLQRDINAYNFGELLHTVLTAFTNLETYKTNFVFLSLQNVMIEVMKIKGSNKYKLPHMNKKKLQREGILPVDLEVDPTLVKECISYLLQLELPSNGMEMLSQQVNSLVPELSLV